MSEHFNSNREVPIGNDKELWKMRKMRQLFESGYRAVEDGLLTKSEFVSGMRYLEENFWELYPEEGTVSGDEER